jgi:hypothetical protein
LLVGAIVSRHPALLAKQAQVVDHLTVEPLRERGALAGRTEVRVHLAAQTS